MATTLQKPPHPSQMDPRLRRAVYAKYREMLVSKNNQANEMIKQLPAYMVREDRGFNTNIITNVVPPPPPIPGSNIPVQRLQSHIQEAPACVQNAMMTKDKKPFTYTPGGIDLSQIKSPRMAKRISANANSPGITNAPKVSPLAQISNDGNKSPMIQTPQSAGVPPPPPLPPMGSLAMGMPFQVFPTGPAPPTKTQQLNKPQTNGTARKSPQSFDPPPMGCRPEIKIPENPMAALRKVPRPQQKDNYWIEEYVQEKARDSAPTEDEIRQYITSPTIQQYQQQQQPEYSPPKPASPIIQAQKPSTPQPSVVPQYMQKRSPSPPEHKEVNVPIRNLKLEENRSSSPTRVQINQSSPMTQQQQLQSQMSSSSSPVTVKNVIFEPIQQNNFNMQPQSYQQPMQNYQQQQPQSQSGGRIILSTMPTRSQQQATQNLGSLYIPPPNIDDKQYLMNQQSPQWMSSKQMSLDTPEWVNRDEIDNFFQQNRNFIMPQQAPPSAGPKEHVIPISFDKSPTRTPATPNYGPTPFYGTPQHHINSVITPKVDPNANKFVNQGYNNIDYPPVAQQNMRPYGQTPKQQQQQPAGTRIIPIQVEGARAPQQNENTVVMQSDPRSPPSPRMNPFGPPTQSRSFKILQQVTGTMGGDLEDDSNESKPKNKSDDDEEPMAEQKPIFSRPLGPNDMNESQLKRLQLSDNDRAFMNRIKNQVDEEIFLHSESDPRYRGSAIPSKAFKCLQKMTDGSQSHNNNDNESNAQAVPAGRQNQNNGQDEAVDNQAREPGLYQGSAIPSRSFKILQTMVQPENADDNSNDNSDIEGNSYTNIGNNFYNNYHTCNPLNCQNCHNNLPNNHNYHCTVPQMYPPQFMMPPEYAALYDWYNPQNNPWAAYYYHHPGYDSNYFGYMPQQPQQNPSHSRSQTPQPSQMSQSQPVPYFYPAYPPPFFIMPPFMGFRPISASRETTPCYSEAERYQNMSTASEDRSRRAVSCTPTCCQHAKSFQVENLSNKFHTFEEPLTRSVSVQSDNPLISHPPEPPEIKQECQAYPIACDTNIRRSLKSIPSVGNVNLLNEDCELEELQAKPIVTTCDDDDDASETSEDTTEVEEEISQDTETAEMHFPHQLSIIYEENESAAANERRCSRSSTLSDCSTTLMEEDNLSVDNSNDELDDENSSSVTVRLPLKFSFTRSKDNMVNTTLTVGESESEFNENHEKQPEKSPSPMPAAANSLSNNSSANDISVTFSLKSKSKSKTPERLVPPTLSAVKCDSIEEVDDNECSVNISLPRKKSRSIEVEEIPKRFRKDSEGSENSHSMNSSDNKVHIDNSLYTSLDALEEIKKGMAEITNSLFSKICTLRKSAINIPEQDRNRSGSISYIDSIESDDENGELLSDNEEAMEVPNTDTNKQHESHSNANDVPEILQKVSKNLQELLVSPQNDETSRNFNENFINEDIKHQYKRKSIDVNPYEPEIIESLPENKTPTQEPQNNDEDVDFWGQIADKNQDANHNLSKTSTHSSSRYWFEEETDDALEPPKDDGFAHYETNDVTTSISFVSINDAATIENEQNEDDETDFWKDYDSDGDFGMKAKKFFESDMRNEDERRQNDEIDATEVSVYEDPMQVDEFGDVKDRRPTEIKVQVSQSYYGNEEIEDEQMVPKVHEFEEKIKEDEAIASRNQENWILHDFSQDTEHLDSNLQNKAAASDDHENYGYAEDLQNGYECSNDFGHKNIIKMENSHEVCSNNQEQHTQKSALNEINEKEILDESVQEFQDQNCEPKPESIHESNLSSITGQTQPETEFKLKRSATPYTKTWENKSEYDDDSDTESCKAFEQEVLLNDQKPKEQQIIKVPQEKVKEALRNQENEELESDEEWTEEEIEVTDEDEIESNQLPQVTPKVIEAPKIEIKMQPKIDIKPQLVDDEDLESDEESSEYEESESDSEEVVAEKVTKDVKVVKNDNFIGSKVNDSKVEQQMAKNDKIKPNCIKDEHLKPQNTKIEHLKQENNKMELTKPESEKIKPQSTNKDQIQNSQKSDHQKSLKVTENSSSDSESEEEVSTESDDDENSNLKAQTTKVQNSQCPIVNSASRIIKGKSLVNVNSFIQSESDRVAIKELKNRIDSDSKSESSDEEEEEEIEDDNEPPLPVEGNCSSSNNIISHSNDDCHDVLTQEAISSSNSNNNDNNNINDNNSNFDMDNDKVLLTNLKEIHSMDSKSNMTSESGISFENNYPDSEDGYEEDSEDENIINSNIKDNEKTIKESKIPQFDERTYDESTNEIKVNVKGKISMFERAMSEERTTERKEVPKVPAKYSFRNREASEPPQQFTMPHKNDRAVSEIKEVPKNHKLIDLINQRKSLPPASDEKYEIKSVKEKISSFETCESDANEKRENYRRYGNSKAKSSPLVRSIEESGEEDSGVTSDFCKQLSENETDSENFPELRKLSRYERASTHSRLYKLLQGDDDIPEQVEPQEEVPKEPTTKIPYKSKKIIHNVSVTRRQNPQAAMQAETMEERRQRLCLPLTHQSSSGAESMSSSTTPSPTPGAINEKLVNELVQSLLSQKRGKAFRNLPIEKLHAAAVKILQEDMESNGTLSSADESTVPTVDSTPALTPQEFRNNSSYTEYYDSWQTKDINSTVSAEDFGDVPLMQSKAFRNLQEQQSNANKKLWSARCPRILSSKSINKDLARLSEVRESESPEPNHSRSPSIRCMSTEPMSGENRITSSAHQNHQERQKAAANT